MAESTRAIRYPIEPGVLFGAEGTGLAAEDVEHAIRVTGMERTATGLRSAILVAARLLPGDVTLARVEHVLSASSADGPVVPEPSLSPVGNVLAALAHQLPSQFARWAYEDLLELHGSGTDGQTNGTGLRIALGHLVSETRLHKDGSCTNRSARRWLYAGRASEAIAELVFTDVASEPYRAILRANLLRVLSSTRRRAHVPRGVPTNPAGTAPHPRGPGAMRGPRPPRPPQTITEAWETHAREDDTLDEHDDIDWAGNDDQEDGSGGPVGGGGDQGAQPVRRNLGLTPAKQAEIPRNRPPTSMFRAVVALRRLAAVGLADDLGTVVRAMLILLLTGWHPGTLAGFRPEGPATLDVARGGVWLHRRLYHPIVQARLQDPRIFIRLDPVCLALLRRQQLQARDDTLFLVTVGGRRRLLTGRRIARLFRVLRQRADTPTQGEYLGLIWHHGRPAARWRMEPTVVLTTAFDPSFGVPFDYYVPPAELDARSIQAQMVRLLRRSARQFAERA